METTILLKMYLFGETINFTLRVSKNINVTIKLTSKTYTVYLTLATPPPSGLHRKLIPQKGGGVLTTFPRLPATLGHVGLDSIDWNSE